MLDICFRVVFVWEETGVPGGNPPVWLGDHMTISRTDAGYRTWVAAVRGECINTAPARQSLYTQWLEANNRLLDSLVVECWLRVREVPGSIPSQGPRHTKDVMKMVPVVHWKGKYWLFLKN